MIVLKAPRIIPGAVTLAFGNKVRLHCIAVYCIVLYCIVYFQDATAEEEGEFDEEEEEGEAQ